MTGQPPSRARVAVAGAPARPTGDGGPRSGALPAELWQRQDMRRALAVRDLGTVFRLLQRRGVSQRRIAALTGMSSSEVYEVLRGRKVMAYEVLCRVADGLGVVRGNLGLAYDDETAELMANPPDDGAEVVARLTGQVASVPGAAAPPWPGVPDPADSGRALLAYAAEVTVGTAGEPPAATTSRRPAVPPIPRRLGLDDVVQIEAVTAGLRDLDYRFGGGTCCEPVLAHARRAERLCALPADPTLSRRLLVAVADVHNLAGWTAFDVGLHAVAQEHLAHALNRARQAGVPSLTANVLYRAGRVHLHRGMGQEALRFFQLGQLAAQDSGSHRTVAMLCANIAWTYAELGDEIQAGVHLGRAADEFGRGSDDGADHSDPEPWAQFFCELDMSALAGMSQLATARHSRAAAGGRLVRHSGGGRGSARQHATRARASLESSVAARGHGMARSLAFELGALATACLLDDDGPAGLEVGERALAQAQRLRSRRVLDRLRPLAALAVAWPGPSAPAEAIRDLGHRIGLAVSGNTPAVTING